MADNNKKPNALIAFLESSSKKPSAADEPAEESDYKPSTAEIGAARDILSAIEAKDPEALCKALYAHGEVRELGPESEEDEG